MTFDASLIVDARKKLEQHKGAKEKTEKDLKDSTREVKRQQIKLKQAESAIEISKQVGLKTQQELEFHISNLVSAALASVFPDNPYKFKVNFVERRGKTECDLRLERNGELVNALSSVGGGVVDITSLALRIASLSMKSGHIRPLLLLDEPFKHLSVDLQERAEAMLHELSTRIGIQVIYNSHTTSAEENTDKLFKVKLVDGVSRVSQI